ncbi:MAG TPA: type II toxin-antitoxin system Phd/YefM family antitoxin [Bryobacteraceae bacterium]|nr:type II toxin-antitoxin system Phd/YefM family antitoxin [Bryobacteraceae bacterium]
MDVMAAETTYTALRKDLAGVLDQVFDNQETVIVRRRGARDVALIPASELSGLLETAHLLRSPRNARRLLTALHRANGRKTKPSTVAQLRQELLGEGSRQ